MKLDETGREPEGKRFGDGFLEGVGAERNSSPQRSDLTGAYARGYRAGRAAYLAAEQAERDRLDDEAPTTLEAANAALDAACAARRGG